MPKISVSKVHPASGCTRAPAIAMAMPAIAMAALALAMPARHAIADPAVHAPIVLHAAHLLEVDSGRLVTRGEVLVEGEQILAVGTSVTHPAGAQVIDLGDATLLPGLIDAHVHLFL